MFKLRPYQVDATKSVVKHFKNNDTPSVIVLPTGSGKSLVIAELARISNGRVLVLAHVKELVEQNYNKFLSYGLEAGIYSAGLSRKDSSSKVIFGSIQSVVNATEDFFTDFSLVIIDECHRISTNKDSQYRRVFDSIKKNNSKVKFLGLTATPYRLDLGWIYNYHYSGLLRSESEKFFKHCIYELSLSFMVKNEYLTPPVLIDSPVACYDFSQINPKSDNGLYSLTEIKTVLKDQKRVTPGIIKNILDQSKDRNGVMIFTSSVKHAEEILELLPKGISAIVTGSTDLNTRDQIINDFKSMQLKYLVNVSVLTTGFDAPHVDLIAILRPTESVGLYQQIVGRGLRLYPNKVDCLILDYTGTCMNLFNPQVNDKRVDSESVAVTVECPKCNMNNEFWGIVDEENTLVEHFGRKCHRGTFDENKIFKACGYLFRFKFCPSCSTENDIAARSCSNCKELLIDPDAKLKEAMSLKDAHVLRVEHMEFVSSYDKKNNEKLIINYYDADAQNISESYTFSNEGQKMAFFHNFVRHHLKRPEKYFRVTSSEDIVDKRFLFREPSFVIARKVKNYWVVREKIFN